MSTNTSHIPAPTATGSQGRAFFLAGLGACLLGVVLIFVQFSMKWLFVPWYSPALASLGAALLVFSVIRQPGLLRGAALLLVLAFAGVQWFFLGAVMKLPDYAGPAQAGTQIPPFRATLADSRPLTDADLRDGTRRVLVFFRGRW